MARSFNIWDSPFLVDKPKLTRLVGVIREHLEVSRKSIGQEFQVGFGSHRTVTTHSLEEVFDLDNTRKHRISELDIKAHSSRGNVEIIMRGAESSRRIMALVVSEETKWVTETMSAVDEQIDRMLKTDLMHKLSHNLRHVIPLFALGFAFVLLVPFLVLMNIDPRSRTLWLDDKDLPAVEQMLSDNAQLTVDQQGMILALQLKNVVGYKRGLARSLSTLKDLRFYFLAVPVVLILAALVYLLRNCYPIGLFLWGDMQEWYDNLVGRRKAIWTAVVLSTAIGIVGNLFVYGLGGYLRF